MSVRPWCLALVLIAVPASASLLEETTQHHATYQFDGGTDADAPDTCLGLATATHDFRVPIGNSTHGFVIVGEDPADHYNVSVTSDMRGHPLTVGVLRAQAGPSLEMDVFIPGCGTSVTDTSNQPSPRPSPPKPHPGEKQVSPHNMPSGSSTGTDCSDHWSFIINQLRSLPAPASIYVVWSDGSRAEVPLAKVTPAKTAHYIAADNGYTLYNVTANLDASWTGVFNVGAKPCGTVDGQVVFGDPSEDYGSRITFTPTRTGNYVLQIVAGNVTVEPSASPSSCHTSCLPGLAKNVEPIEYDAFTL